MDASGWLEYFADDPNAGFFARAIWKPAGLIVPTVSLYEVFKRVLRQRDETRGLRAAAVTQQGRIVDLAVAIALSAAGIAAEMPLSMAARVMLATARAHNAVLWPWDEDLEGLEGLRYTPAP